MFKQAIILAVFLSVAGLQGARAQSNERKFEVGGQFSLLRLSTQTIATETCPLGSICFDLIMTAARGRQTEPGFGGRIGYNVSHYFALEAESNFYLRNRASAGGRKVQGLFGAKGGKRFDTFGIFAKARPGLVRFSKGDYQQFVACILIFPPPAACFQSVSKTRFAVDLGGVAEWYPSKNTIIRFDAGDTIIRFSDRMVPAFAVSAAGSGPIRPVVVPIAAETTHNFQASVGIGYRF